MGKKNRRGGGGGSAASGATGGAKFPGGGGRNNTSGQSSAQQQREQSRGGEDPYSLYSWLKHEKSAPYYILSFVCIGFLIGLGIGTGYLTNAASAVPGLGALSSTNPAQTRWRVALGRSVRSSMAYGLVYGRKNTQLHQQQQPTTSMEDLPEANEYRADGDSPSSPPTAQPTTSTSSPEPKPSAAGGSPKPSPRTASAPARRSGRGGFLSNLFSSSNTYR